MNPNNYASLEASKRLVEAGIVLETEAVWAFNEWIETVNGGAYGIEEWRLIRPPLFPYKQQIPAPSMAEAWRELPEDTTMRTAKGFSIARYVNAANYSNSCEVSNVNPTDTLIDLLIWVRKEATDAN